MRVFVAFCAVAGALGVPLSPVETPLAAAIAGAAGYVGVMVWRWSRLSSATRPTGSAVSLGVAFLMGLGVGLLALALIRLVVEPSVPAAGARIAIAGTLPLWRRLAIIYVAAVSEELIFRLFLFSLVAGVLTRFSRRALDGPSRETVMIANVLCALMFGAIHLPAWMAIGSLSAGLIAMILVLNGMGGLLFGHLFATRGIIAAMWAHAGADCAIQLIGPMTSSMWRG